jgi:hypothetical protein
MTQDSQLTTTGFEPPTYQSFNLMFLYSTFIGGPTCTCTPISPSPGRPGTSSSTTMVIMRLLMMWVSTFPRTIRWTAFQSSVTASASSLVSPIVATRAQADRFASGRTSWSAAHAR